MNDTLVLLVVAGSVGLVGLWALARFLGFGGLVGGLRSLLGGTGSAAATATGEAIEETGEVAGESAGSATETTGETAESIVGTAGETAESVVGAVGAVVEETTASVEEGAATVGSLTRGNASGDSEGDAGDNPATEGDE